MQYPQRNTLVIILVVMTTLACALPVIPIQDPGAISTAAAQTVIAGLTLAAPPVTQATTQTAIVESPTATAVPPTSTLTPTPSATLTPTQTLTPTLFFTSTPVVPLISVSVPTNCRSGPGKVYDLLGYLLVGEVAEVYGRSASGDYWYIRNPDSPSTFCWLWGQYATVTGNIGGLPIYTPPPSPTPAPGFAAGFNGLDTCTVWWAKIQLENTGSIPFRSMALTVRDTVTDTALTSYSDVFISSNGCLVTATRDNLAVGRTIVVSSPGFNYNPRGHRMEATITLCSKQGQNGICVTKTITFKP